MEIRETLLHRFVESFRMCIHLGCLWIGVVVKQVETTQFLVKMLFEFTPIVGQDKRQGKREDLDAEFEKLSCSKGGMGAGSHGKAKSRVDVFKRDDVAAHAMVDFFKGIERHAMSRKQCLKILRFSQNFLTIGSFDFSEVGDLLGKSAEASQIMHEAANGFWFGICEGERYAELTEKRIEFFFAKIGIHDTQTPKLGYDTRIPEALPPHAWSPTSRVQGFNLAASFVQFLLPCEQGAFLNLKRIKGSGKPVLLPEHQNLVSTLGFLCNHIPPAYHFLPAGYEAFCALKLVKDAHL